MQEDLDSQSGDVALYDFVYLDRRRISLLASQLFKQGLLTSTIERSARQNASNSTLGLSAAIVKGSIDSRASTDESIERQFDATWSVPLDVIDELRAANKIVENISAAEFGQLVTMRGALQLYDIGMLRTMYEPMLDFIMQSARTQLDAQFATARELIDAGLASAKAAEKHKWREQKRNFEALKKKTETDQIQQRDQVSSILALVKLLPHALQATIVGDNYSAWMTLDPQQMVTNPEDFALKHGSSVPGAWRIIGSLDARPEPEAVIAPLASTDAGLSGILGSSNEGTLSEEEGSEGSPSGETAAHADGNTKDLAGVVQMMRQMHDMIRSQFGRPNNAYGITPIAIYRVLQ